MAKTKRSIGHIKKLDDNKYLLRLSLGFDDFGKRLQPSKVVECKSDREAERFLLEFYNQKEQLLRESTSYVPKTLEQLYNYWMEHYVQKELKRTTAEWYISMWDRILSSAGSIRLEIISAAHIHALIESADGTRNKNALFKMLKAMLNKGVRWGFIDTNPCQKMDTPKYKAPEKKALSTEELQLLTNEIKAEPLKYQAIFYFAVVCSLRRQAIVGLKWADIDFTSSSFKVNRAAVQLSGIGTVPDTPKTEKSKVTLHLPDVLKDILLKLQREQLIERMKWGSKWVDEDWIFTQDGGKMMCLATPSHWWKKFAPKYGINDITFHGLRHTAATHMIKNNIPISTVSGILGHANITTTLNTYTHVIEDTKKTAIDIMADVVTGKTSAADPKAV